MGGPSITVLLAGLRSTDAEAAWADFMQEYSPILYQVARAYAADPDGAADCYLNICEHLARNGFRRLLSFKPEGTAGSG